jgi:hypothetical protein
MQELIYLSIANNYVCQTLTRSPEAMERWLILLCFLGWRSNLKKFFLSITPFSFLPIPENGSDP